MELTELLIEVLVWVRIASYVIFALYTAYAYRYAGRFRVSHIMLSMAWGLVGVTALSTEVSWLDFETTRAIATPWSVLTALFILFDVAAKVREKPWTRF